MKRHSRLGIVIALLVAALALTGVCSAAVAPGGVTLGPGTSTILVGGTAFIVTTDRPISLALNFSSPDLIEGVVVPRDAQTTSVRIVWRDVGLTIFSGAVVQITPIRYFIPKDYQAAQDSGHSEK